MSQAYRYHYIQHNHMRDEFYIMKDGFCLQTCKSVDEAKKIIDDLLEDGAYELGGS